MLFYQLWGDISLWFVFAFSDVNQYWALFHMPAGLFLYSRKTVSLFILKLLLFGFMVCWLFCAFLPVVYRFFFPNLQAVLCSTDAVLITFRFQCLAHSTHFLLDTPIFLPHFFREYTKWNGLVLPLKCSFMYPSAGWSWCFSSCLMVDDVNKFIYFNPSLCHI